MFEHVEVGTDPQRWSRSGPMTALVGVLALLLAVALPADVARANGLPPRITSCAYSLGTADPVQDLEVVVTRTTVAAAISLAAATAGGPLSSPDGASAWFEPFTWDEDDEELASGGGVLAEVQVGPAYSAEEVAWTEEKAGTEFKAVYYRLNDTEDGPDGDALCSVTIRWAAAGGAGGGSGAAGPSFVAPGGVQPLVSPGLGEWVRADGTSTPLVLSAPGPNQVRYSADGIQVTFTGGAGSAPSRGLVADPDGDVVCEICLFLAAGGTIEAWVFSEPRLAAAWRIEDLPCQTFTIPVGAPLDGLGPIPAGAHTLQLALPTANGMQAVNVGLTVGNTVPARIPAGEGPAVPFGMFVVAGFLAAVAGVRRMAVTRVG